MTITGSGRGRPGLASRLGRRLLPRLGTRPLRLVLWGGRRVGAEERVSAAILREAQRRFRAGDHDGGNRALAAVGSPPVQRTTGGAPAVADGDHRTLIAEVRRLVGEHDLLAARDLAEHAVARHPRVIRLTDLLIGLLEQTGEPDRALELAVDNARRRVTRLERLRDEPPPPRRLSREQRILVSGYFYSGSSAVLDWLRDFPGTAKWAPTGEMRLLKFPGGYGDLAKHHAEHDGLSSQDLVDLYLHVTGWKVTLNPPGTYDHWDKINRNSRRMFRRPVAHGYLAVLLDSFVTLAEDPEVTGSTEALEAYLRDSVGRALDAAATDAGADLLLVDQAITGWRFELTRLVPPATFVSVHRDPRDQYTEVRRVLEQPGRKQIDAATFARRYRANRGKVDRLAPEAERDHGHQVVRLGFEDFVVDHDREAARLAGALDLDLDARVPERFDPTTSRANIGKHAGLLDEEDRTVLEDELAEYLSPHANAVIEPAPRR